MAFATFVSVICLALNLVAVAAMSTTSSAIQDTAWTIGDVQGLGIAYVGLEEIYMEFDNGNSTSATWNSDACRTLETTANAGDFCHQCEEAATKSIPVALLAVITKIPTIATDIKRSTRRGDMNCQKFMGILTGLLSVFSTIDSLSVYADGCFRNLPEEFNSHNITWKLGPGFVCLLISTLLTSIDAVVNILMPVVPWDGEDVDDKVAVDGSSQQQSSSSQSPSSPQADKVSPFVAADIGDEEAGVAAATKVEMTPIRTQPK